MSFFGITEEDLQDGKARFNANDEAEMSITSVVRKEIKGNDTVIFECIVTNSTNNTGLKYSEFFRIGSEGGRKALGIFLTAFMSAKEAAGIQDPNVLVNKKFTCRFESDGKYVNMRNVRAVSNVPQGLAQPSSPLAQAPAPVQNSVAPTAPTAQTVAITGNEQGQPQLNKGLF